MICSRIGGAALAALAVSAASAVGRAQKPAGATDPQLPARLAAAMQQTAPDLWGIALCAVDGKVVLAEGRGQQDHGSPGAGERPPGAIDRDSLFDLGGLADRLTAIAALQLLGQKRWQLDDAIARVVSDWPKEKAAITWRHLLQHTSGLPPEADWGNGRNAARRPAIAAIAATKLVDEPGRAFHWSMLNANLLALLIDQVGGGDFQDYVRRRVLQPAGMSGTGFLDDRRLDDKHMTWRSSGTAAPTPARQFVWDWGQRGARGVLASASDVSSLAAALCGTRLLDGKALAVLLQPLPGGDALRVQQVVRGGAEWTQFHGAVTGYRARLLLQRKTRAWIVLLAGEVDLDPLEAALAAALLPSVAGAVAARPIGAATPAAAGAVPAAATAPPAPVGEAQLARFLGAFALRSGGRFEVVKDGDGIAVLGIGLEASARLQFGRWPVPDLDAALRHAEDRSMAGLQPLVVSDRAPAARCFAGDTAIASAKQLLERILLRVGRDADLQFVGTETTSSRQSWLRLVGGNGTAWLCVAWSTRGTISGVSESQAPPPFRVRFRVERPDWAVAAVGGAAMALSVEGRGASRTLVLEDQGGLAECAWVADLR